MARAPREASTVPARTEDAGSKSENNHAEIRSKAYLISPATRVDDTTGSGVAHFF
jgi:hypothetical protein